MRASRRFVIAGLLFCAVAGGWWWTRPARMNLLVVTLDTTRADRLGAWGGPAGLTPVLDALAADGIVFDRAYAPIPLTLPSHASLMTGLYPAEHGLRLHNGANRLGSEIPVLAELLQQHGYSTGAFVGAFVLDKKFGLDRGFDRYDDNMGEAFAPSAGDPHEHRSRPGEQVVHSALAWLKGRRAPFFCWVHLFDPHTPYRAREELYGDRYRDRPYDAGIAYVDGQVGRLLAFLRQNGLDESTLVVIAGDHGESLGEHQERTHGFTLYEATLHVPLIVKWPRSDRAADTDLSGKRIAVPVSLVDVFPTVLAALGLKEGSICSGRDLLPACRGAELPLVACYAETDHPYEEGGWAGLRGLVTDRWKYIRSPRPELYDLAADPRELTNLAERHPAELQELERALQEREALFEEREAPTVVSAPLDKRKLASLGYVGGGKAGADREGLADIKDMLPHHNAYSDAQGLMTAGRFQEAADLLEGVVGAVPRYFQAWYNLGVCRQQLRQLPEAEEALRRSVEIDGNAWAQMALSNLYLIQRQPEKAIPHLEAAVRVQPESVEARCLLADAYRMAGRHDDARQEYRQALQMEPRFLPAKQGLQALP